MRSFAYKAALFALLAATVSTVHASKVSTYENKTYRPNSGIVTAPNVFVSDEYGLPGSLSGALAFSLVIPSDSNVRFSAESLSGVVVSGVSGVSSVSVSPDLRSLRFNASAPLPSGANLTVSGIRIVVYGRYSPLRGFDLDIGSDGSIDAYDTNGVRVNEEYGIQDTLAPSDPVNATGSFSAATVTLSATPSGDVDFESFSVHFLSISGDTLKTVLASSLSASAFDLPLGTASVRIQSVDTRSNVSAGVVVSPASTSSGTLVPLLPVSSSGTTTTLPNVGVSASGTVVATVVAYVPTFKSQNLTALISGMDAFIASRGVVDANFAMTARNDLAKSFEAFYRTRLAYKRKIILSQIRTQATALKALLK